MSSTVRTTLACVPLLTALAAVGHAGNVCPSGLKPGAPIKISSAVRLQVERDFPAEVLRDAVALWKACPNYGAGFPRFVTAGEGDFTYRLRFERKNFAGGYCASIGGDEIVIFGSVRVPGRKDRSCGSPAENLAHELGHLLDLADTGDSRACQGHLMGSLYAWRLESRRRPTRAVGQEICRLVDERWLTWEEMERGQGLSRSVELASRD